MKNKTRALFVIIVAVIVTGSGFLGYQKIVREKNQVKMVKTANESYADDARYVTFGANYVFAVPKSFRVDESSLAGVQVLIPAGVDGTELDSFDKLFDAAVVAVQPVPQVEPNDNKGLVKYVKETILPDLKKNISDDAVAKYSYNGKNRSASITVNKDGRQVRHMYLSAGARPFMVVSQTRSDAFIEVVATLLPVAEAKSSTEIDLVKEASRSNLILVQGDKLQEAYDGASDDFQKDTTFKAFSTAIAGSKNHIRRNIVVLGGSISGDQFAGLLSFSAANEGESQAVGTIYLLKENGVWKLHGLTLPSDSTGPAPTPAPTKK